MYFLIFVIISVISIVYIIDVFDLYTKIGLSLNFDAKVIGLSVIGIAVGPLLYAIDLHITRFVRSFIRDNTFIDGSSINQIKFFSSYSFLLVSIFISFFEELIFRGLGIFLLVYYLKLNLFMAIVVTSIAFGVYHFKLSVAVIPSRIICGMILGILYISANSLIPPALAHSTWNFMIWNSWRREYKKIVDKSK
jgi:membrane protease YdiL (CAAX protease family)